MSGTDPQRTVVAWPRCHWYHAVAITRLTKKKTRKRLSAIWTHATALAATMSPAIFDVAIGRYRQSITAYSIEREGESR